MMINSAPTFPSHLQKVYESYQQRRLLTRELLIAKVRRHTETVMEASREAQLDVGTAGELGMALLRMLRECGDEELAYAQAAVFYFVESDDEEPDLSSPEGFRDDAEFFNCICDFLNRPDLTVRL